jgi:hypothetical protein
MGTVALTIDYSNGAQKHFSSIPWKKGLTILEAIQASEGIPPKASITFGSDRSGHVLGLVIDEVPPKDGPASEWVIWVNAKGFQNRLGTETSFGFHPEERERNLLNAGDHVLVKLAAVVEKSV